MTSSRPGEPAPDPAGSGPGPDLRPLVALVIAAIVLFLPFRAGPGESPWPAALAFAAFATLVGLGGWWVLRHRRPVE